MASVTVSELKSQIDLVRNNPAAIQRTVLAALTRATDGDIEIVDPSNPFVFALESAAVMTAAFLGKNATDTRLQYAAASQTPEDLYPHMSDRDYIDRFASPAITRMSIMFPYEELINKMVLDPATGIRKVVIPRNAFFTVADTVFSIQYPIEIRQLAHGGIQVIYDGEVVSPLQSLESNVIDWEMRARDASAKYVYFEFDVSQFSIISQTGTLNGAMDYKLDVPFEDQYYYTRVYVENAQGNWEEIRTTHTDQIYDATVPTAVLKVVEQTVTIRIPQIYTSTGMLKRAIRVDVYQTKGAIDMDLSNYPLTTFEATWQAFDKADATVYVAPLKTFREIIPFSNRVVVGGRNSIPFETMRDQVIENSIGARKVPITNVQIENGLQDAGYEIVKNVDNITNRVFLATKSMPVPADERLITAAAASIETVSLTVAEAVQLDTVIDNGTSITLTPDTIYQIRGGKTFLVPTQQVNQVLALPSDQRAGVVTNGNYLYSPFHYVLDMTEDEFSLRPYYLDAPEVLTKLFVAQNDTALMQVNVKTYGIARTPTGYRLTVVLESGTTWKALPDDEVHVQLAFIPNGEKDRAYLMGQLSGINDQDERIYTFDLATTFNVDYEDGLEMTEFFLYSTEERITKAALTTDFDIVFSTSAVLNQQWNPNQVDEMLGRFLLPTRIAGITHEKLRVKFGESLHTLWARSRSVISSVPYKTWAVDVPALYEKDVYERDPLTGSAVQIVNGVPTMVLLHAKNSPVLDVDGNPVMRFKKGDIQLDGAGNPQPTNVRGMVRMVDLMLLEGAYWFATDVTTKSYRTRTVRTVVEWLTGDLERMSAQLLEQSRLYFYPKVTMGNINVMILDGVTSTINAGQSFLVTLFVSSQVYANEDLRSQLTTQTVKTLNEQLKKSTVAVSAITEAMRKQYGTDVIDVQLSGLGGTSVNLSALTVLDEGDRCSIRKRLVAQADDTLVVQEDVTVTFVRHEMAPQ